MTSFEFSGRRGTLQLVHSSAAHPPRSTPVVVFTEGFVDRLHRVNAVTRRLRAWGIVVRTVNLRTDDERPPKIIIRHDPTHSLAPLLDATQGNRTWLPAQGVRAAIAQAMLDGVAIQWELAKADKLIETITDNNRSLI